MAKNALAHTIGIKWMEHAKGDPKGIDKPESDGCTLSILVSQADKFRLEFASDKKCEHVVRSAVLEKYGDFVIWGGGTHHQWFVDEDSTILTVRWVPTGH